MSGLQRPMDVRVWAYLLSLKKDLDNCNPDVGFPPSTMTLLGDIETHLKIQLTLQERKDVLKYWENTYNRF